MSRYVDCNNLKLYTQRGAFLILVNFNGTRYFFESFHSAVENTEINSAWFQLD